MTEQQKNAVVAWVRNGNVKGAAAELGLSPKTVEYHLQQIRKQLKLPHLIWLAIWAVNSGIVEQ